MRKKKRRRRRGIKTERVNPLDYNLFFSSLRLFFPRMVKTPRSVEMKAQNQTPDPTLYERGRPWGRDSPCHCCIMGAVVYRVDLFPLRGGKHAEVRAEEDPGSVLGSVSCSLPAAVSFYLFTLRRLKVSFFFFVTVGDVFLFLSYYQGFFFLFEFGEIITHKNAVIKDDEVLKDSLLSTIRE